MSSLNTEPSELAENEPAGALNQGRRSKVVKYLALNRLSGVYGWLALFILFSIWEPSTFLTSATATSIGSNQAVNAILAMALILPLAAGLFDLSIAATLGMASCLALYLQVHGVDPFLTIVACLAAGTVVGAINGLIVVRLGVSSFIATLGMSSVLAAVSYMITNGNELVAGPGAQSFVNLGQGSLLTVPDPVWYAVIVALVVLYITEWTTAGRYAYSVGGNLEASRLVGIRVSRIMFGSLISAGFLAALAGTILAAQLGSATYDIGPAYLLPAFSAVLLGATQIKINGRANVLGTLVAVILLATGIYGLTLAGAPSWVPDMFNGVALIVAVSLAVRANRRG
jgi:ribose transport system permease protein